MPKQKDVGGPKTWTYGCEHEFGDWDTRKGVPLEFGIDPEPNIHNSNGIAGDPTLKDNPFGGEINTPPTSSPVEQGELLKKFRRKHRRLYVGAMGMHVHIRVPGLIDSLPALKKIQAYVCRYGKQAFQFVDPIEHVTKEVEAGLPKDEAKARRRWVNWLRMSHWTTLSEQRLAGQLKTTTVKAFFEAEAPRSRTGKVMYHAQPRCGVSLRQLLQTNTIEFRHFFQTADPQVVINSVWWCNDFLVAALNDRPIGELIETYYRTQEEGGFPSPPEFIYWHHRRFYATNYGKHKRDVVRENVRRIWAGEFDDISNEPFQHLRRS